MSPYPTAVPRVLLLLLASLISFGCSPDPLDPTGEVKLWTNRPSNLVKLAEAELPGLRLAILEARQNWGILIRAPGQEPDLVVTDLNLDLAQSAHQGLVMDMTPWIPRMRSLNLLWPGLAPLQKTFPHFLPSHLYLWQMIHHRNVIKTAGIEDFRTLATLEESFRVLKSRGVVPLALGASFGWPALGLLAQLDIRFNGPEAYLKTLRSERRLDDSSLLKVYQTLARWRDQGWINSDAGEINWSEALRMVQEGKAAFTFLGVNTLQRLGTENDFGISSFPEGGEAKYPGELAVIQGFAVFQGAKAPEAALALADKAIYLGADTQGTDNFRIPALPQQKSSPGDMKETAVQIHQRTLISSGLALLPQLDRVLPPQAAYDANLVMAEFFRTGSTMSAEDLSKEMGSLVSSRPASPVEQDKP